MLHVPYTPTDRPRDVEMECDLTIFIEPTWGAEGMPELGRAVSLDWASRVAELFDEETVIDSHQLKTEWLNETEVAVTVQVRLLFEMEEESKETLEERWSNDDWLAYSDSLNEMIPSGCQATLTGSATVTDLDHCVDLDKGEVVVRPLATGSAKARLVSFGLVHPLSGLGECSESQSGALQALARGNEPPRIATLTVGGTTVALFHMWGLRAWMKPGESEYTDWQDRDFSGVDPAFLDYMIDVRLHLLEIIAVEFGHESVELWPSFSYLPAWTPFEQDLAVDLAIAASGIAGIGIKRIEMRETRNPWERPRLLTAASFAHRFDNRSRQEPRPVQRTKRVEIAPDGAGGLPAEGIRIWELSKD